VDLSPGFKYFAIVIILTIYMMNHYNGNANLNSIVSSRLLVNLLKSSSIH